MKEYVIEVHYDAVKKVSVFSETEEEAKKMADAYAKEKHTYIKEETDSHIYMNDGKVFEID